MTAVDFAVERAKRTGRCPRCDTAVVVVPDPPCVIETRMVPLGFGPPMHWQHTSQRCRDLRDARRSS